MGIIDEVLGIRKYDMSREVPKEKDFPSKEVIMTKGNIDRITGRFPFIFLDFHAHWCAPCKKMKPKIKWLAREMKGKIIVCTVNVANETEISTKYNVRSVPTYILLHYEDEITRWKGRSDITRISKELEVHWKSYIKQKER